MRMRGARSVCAPSFLYRPTLAPGCRCVPLSPKYRSGRFILQQSVQCQRGVSIDGCDLRAHRQEALPRLCADRRCNGVVEGRRCEKPGGRISERTRTCKLWIVPCERDGAGGRRCRADMGEWTLACMTSGRYRIHAPYEGRISISFPPSHRMAMFIGKIASE